MEGGQTMREGVKAPRAPRRLQTEVDEARRTANELRAELQRVRAERRRYREALKRISKLPVEGHMAIRMRDEALTALNQK
jgi:predicted  nucleic acid-binding Zn-ribbon protein